MGYGNSCGETSCGTSNVERNFHTKEEKIEMLETYKKQLDEESKGVQENITRLKKAA